MDESVPLGKVMIVDDDPAIVRFLEKFFTRRHYTTVSASNGTTALDIFAAELPQVILVDIQLPPTTGLDVVQRIKEISPRAETILLTGFPQTELAVKGLQLGATDFITKPIDSGKLLKAVENAIIRHQMHQERSSYTTKLERLALQKEEELKKIETELAQTEKMSALGELAAGITHEINQPLTSMRLACQGMIFTLEDNALDAQKMKEFLEDLLRQVDNVSDIVVHMRDFVRSSGNDRCQFVDVNKIMEDVLRISMAQFRHQNITVEKKFSEHLPKIYSNPIKMEQVFMNILANARDALMESGKPERVIGISTDIATGLSQGPAMNKISVSIADNANGIPTDIQEKIFKPFFTTKGRDRGTGLGLSITKRIMESLGGTVSLQSRPGEGTTFYLLFCDASVQAQRKAA